MKVKDVMNRLKWFDGELEVMIDSEGGNKAFPVTIIEFDDYENAVTIS